MILPKIRDKRLILIRRGGLLTEEHHKLIAIWAADCSSHVLNLFETEHPDDYRPRQAIELAYKWAKGLATVTEAKIGAYHANIVAKELNGSAKYAAYSAGQAAAVAHVAAHNLGAAAYAIRAVMCISNDKSKEYQKEENIWQISKLPYEIKELVIEDEHNRNSICWNVFLVE